MMTLCNTLQNSGCSNLEQRALQHRQNKICCWKGMAGDGPWCHQHISRACSEPGPRMPRPDEFFSLPGICLISCRTSCLCLLGRHVDLAMEGFQDMAVDQTCGDIRWGMVRYLGSGCHPTNSHMDVHRPNFHSYWMLLDPVHTWGPSRTALAELLLGRDEFVHKVWITWARARAPCAKCKLLSRRNIHKTRWTQDRLCLFKELGFFRCFGAIARFFVRASTLQITGTGRCWGLTAR